MTHDERRAAAPSKDSSSAKSDASVERGIQLPRPTPEEAAYLAKIQATSSDYDKTVIIGGRRRDRA